MLINEPPFLKIIILDLSGSIFVPEYDPPVGLTLATQPVKNKLRTIIDKIFFIKKHSTIARILPTLNFYKSMVTNKCLFKLWQLICNQYVST